MPQSAVPRNVFVFDANVPAGAEPSLVGGMFQFGQTTGVDFYLCLEICFHLPERATFRLKAADGIILPRDGIPVRTGSYTVVTLGRHPPFPLVWCLSRPSPELIRDPYRWNGAPPKRIERKPSDSWSIYISVQCWSKIAFFRDCVRERDLVCKVSGADTRPSFTGLEACHIIPRSHFDHVGIPCQLQANMSVDS